MKNKIIFKNPLETTDSDIKDIEEFTGFILPENIKAFFKFYANSEIMFNDNTQCFFDLIYKDGWDTDDALQQVESLKSIKEKWEHRGYLKQFQKEFDVNSEYVDHEKLFPLIETYGGAQIYIAIGGDYDGKIFHVDNGDFGFCYLTESLDELLNKCYSIA
ncbi:SMI1/KNR4 family protein [Tenacibaculum sp. M341]|uniref:SMI1/KNR4 family protein n=1 Tax=Tenacibaculum sp. M341 TaxID=2530339 RepID=UPI001043DB60|nr:SMI1/KNR4 family protein [Tenacibaculum sp. M341]TCI85541.1 hypothetical protein EYW44_16405 [Tenacibaculum sp. M341]